MSLMIIEHGEYSDFSYHVVDVPDGMTSDGIRKEWEAYFLSHDWDARQEDMPYVGDNCYDDFCRWMAKYHPEIKPATIPVINGNS